MCQTQDAKTFISNSFNADMDPSDAHFENLGNTPPSPKFFENMQIDLFDRFVQVWLVFRS